MSIDVANEVADIVTYLRCLAEQSADAAKLADDDHMTHEAAVLRIVADRIEEGYYDPLPPNLRTYRDQRSTAKEGLMTTRENGYYWVRYGSYGAEDVAYWDGSAWKECRGQQDRPGSMFNPAPTGPSQFDPIQVLHRVFCDLSAPTGPHGGDYHRTWYENRRPGPTGPGSQDELRSRVDLAVKALEAVTDLDDDARVRMVDVLGAAHEAVTILTSRDLCGDGASGAIGPGTASIDWSRFGSCSMSAPAPSVATGCVVEIVRPTTDPAPTNLPRFLAGDYLVEFLNTDGDSTGVTRLGTYGYSESWARWGWTVDGVFVYDAHVRVVSDPIVRKETRLPGLYRIRDGLCPVELADWDGHGWYRIGTNVATHEKVRVKLTTEPEVLGRHQRVRDEGYYWIRIGDAEPVLGSYGSGTFLQGWIRVASPPSWTTWGSDEEVADETVRVVSGRLVPPVIPSVPTGAVGLTG